jgi:hypothetical protein
MTMKPHEVVRCGNNQVTCKLKFPVPEPGRNTSRALIAADTVLSEGAHLFLAAPEELGPANPSMLEAALMMGARALGI